MVDNEFPITKQAHAACFVILVAILAVFDIFVYILYIYYRNSGYNKQKERKLKMSAIDQITSPHGRGLNEKLSLVNGLDPASGAVKDVLEVMVWRQSESHLLIAALRKAAEAPLSNQIAEADLHWFIYVMMGVSEVIETMPGLGDPADYGRMMSLMNAHVQEQAIQLLGSEQLNRPLLSWLNHAGTGTEVRQRKLALILGGKLEEALKPLPSKTVSWEVVRNIANALTNQLYLGQGVDLSQAHLSSFFDGPKREFILEDGHRGDWRVCQGENGWHAFHEEDVRQLLWASHTSGNALQARKEEAGKWLLEYIPSVTDPFHRGVYYGLYENSENVKNIEFKQDHEA